MTNACTANSGGTSVFINSFYNRKYALPHNYIITKFTGYARVLNYLDSGKFHVGKNPPHGGIRCGKLALFAQCIPWKFMILQGCIMFLEGDVVSFGRVCHVLDNNCLRMTKIIRKVTQVNSHCTRCGRGLFTATKRLHTKVTPSSACFFSRSFFPRKTKALFCKQASNRKLDTTLRTKRSLAVFFQ